jgi:hypothetical protein
MSNRGTFTAGLTESESGKISEPFEPGGWEREHTSRCEMRGTLSVHLGSLCERRDVVPTADAGLCANQFEALHLLLADACAPVLPRHIVRA